MDRMVPLMLLFLLQFVSFQNIVEAEAILSIEDIPDYEILQFPYKSNASARSNTNKKHNKQDQTTAKPKPPSSPTTTSENSPCSCKYGACTCCSGPVLGLIGQKACLKIVYTPEDFAFDFSMMLNNRVMYQNKVSGKNPPPACISLPRLNSLRMCTKFSNVYFVGRNLHVCLGMEGRWDSYELFSFSFDCLRMGSDGFHFLKPEDGGYPTGVVGGLDAIIDAGDDIEDYDENVVRSAKANILRMIRNNQTLIA